MTTINLNSLEELIKQKYSTICKEKDNDFSDKKLLSIISSEVESTSRLTYFQDSRFKLLNPIKRLSRYKDTLRGILSILVKVHNFLIFLNKKLLKYEDIINKNRILENEIISLQENYDFLHQQLEILRLITSENQKCQSINENKLRNISFSLNSIESEVFIKSQNLKKILNTSYYSRLRGRSQDVNDLYLHRFNLLRDLGLFVANNRCLDLGCGRGEWLKVLKNNSISCVGVDNDTNMIEHCIANNLNVIKGDIVEVLKSFKNTDFDFISLIHVIEHLNINYLCELLVLIRQIVDKDGILYIEIPNIHNPLVSSTNYYIDPSHKSKYPIELLEHLLSIHEFDVLNYSFQSIDKKHKEIFSSLKVPDPRYYCYDLTITAKVR